MPRRRRCSCTRLVGTYSNGHLRRHKQPNGRPCPVFGPSLHKATVRRLVTTLGAREAAVELRTSAGTLYRKFGAESWWPTRADNPNYGNYTHVGHVDNRGYQAGCPGCLQRGKDYRAERAPDAAERAEARERRRAARAVVEWERKKAAAKIAEARAYVAEMVASGRARDLRIAAGVTCPEVEEQLGLGRTSLSKIECGRRPPLARVHAHVLGYAALLRQWERRYSRASA